MSNSKVIVMGPPDTTVTKKTYTPPSPNPAAKASTKPAVKKTPKVNRSNALDSGTFRMIGKRYKKDAPEELDMCDDFIQMISLMRPSRKSRDPEYVKWLDRFLLPIMGVPDDYDNFIHIITTDGKPLCEGNMPRVAYMAHHDTVHKDIGSQYNRLAITGEPSLSSDYENLILYVRNPKPKWEERTVTEKRWNKDLKASVDTQITKKMRVYPKAGEDSNCLGADCTTGVWLISEMIQADVPGIYVVHNNEEIGCLGAEHIIKDYQNAIKLVDTLDPNSQSNEEEEQSYESMSFDEKLTLHPYSFWIGYCDIAISFDRWGTNSIITHQTGTRTASQEFVDDLSGILSPKLIEFGYEDLVADDGGSYTDSNKYKMLISECTNLAVGYMHQHSERESQDLSYMISLRDSLVDNGMRLCDPSQLGHYRDCTVVESKWGNRSHSSGGRGSWHGGGYGSYGNYGAGAQPYSSEDDRKFWEAWDAGMDDPFGDNTTPRTNSNLTPSDIRKSIHKQMGVVDETDVQMADLVDFEDGYYDRLESKYAAAVNDLEAYMTPKEAQVYIDYLDACEQYPEIVAYLLATDGGMSVEKLTNMILEKGL